MANSKVILNGTTLIDLTQDTVTASSMLSGVTAHGNDGESVTGTIATKTSSDVSISDNVVTVASGYYASNTAKTIESITIPQGQSFSVTAEESLQDDPQNPIDVTNYVNRYTKVWNYGITNVSGQGNTQNEVFVNTSNYVSVQGCNTTQVEVEAPLSGTRTVSVTVPNGANDTITFTFTVDSNGNTTIE